MKYPQLVSIRAVNAISDWLEPRLEQLGIESAQLYSRLLLSLLQTTIQLNDPIEINNLEVINKWNLIIQLFQILQISTFLTFINALIYFQLLANYYKKYKTMH